MSVYDTLLSGENAAFLVDMLARWQKDPKAVEPQWADFFSSLGDEEQSALFELGGASWRPEQKPSKQAAADMDGLDKTSIIHTIRALMLIRTWRVRGHLSANLDPLNLAKKELHPELHPSFFGFSDDDWDIPIFLNHYLGVESATLHELMEILKETYGSDIGVEYMHIMDPDIKAWVQQHFEDRHLEGMFSKDERIEIHKNLAKAESLEQILARRFVGTKRFGLDGGESTICSIEEILKTEAKLGAQEVVLGMAHRGRLNVLSNILQKPFRAIISEFEGKSFKPEDVQGSGDVKYHLGASAVRHYGTYEIRVALEANPSHLEAVNPVVLGKVRAKQDRHEDTKRETIVGLLIHGDAAFSGQGIVPESLMMSELTGYETGGTIHLIINNQIGFTTHPHYSRSSPYCSDVAKMIQCPIFHVNGDNPEAVVFVSRLAAEFQKKFQKDVVIDLFCYRRFGHNEGDEPRFTQPVMYKRIDETPTCYEKHAQKLLQEQLLSEEEIKKIRSDIDAFFDGEFIHGQSYQPEKADWFMDRWAGLVAPSFDSSKEERIDVPTCVDEQTLTIIGLKLCEYPKGFHVHPKVKRMLAAKRKMIETGKNIDWATAEGLAFGSLLNEGIGVRLSGEDSGRGTFSHRHAVFVNQTDESKYIPLTQITDKARFEVWDSPLSEYGVLGYEYGYASAEPWKLVLWEAQFGDFANGGQIMIDQFISSSESKWLRMCGLVMLLPHGFEGQGPEHSSARLERYLQLCAENNMQVIHPTTPANYFHALRRQMKRNFRKPLIVMAPKSPLRHKLVVSDMKSFTDDQYFRRMIDETDQLVADDKIRRLILCSGKIYWDLLQARRDAGIDDIAIVRIEQLYPFPWSRVEEQFTRYKNAEIIWAQEEPANAGPWTFVYHRLYNVLLKMKQIERPITYVGRRGSASASAGLMMQHTTELKNIIKWALHTPSGDIPQPFQAIAQWQRD